MSQSPRRFVATIESVSTCPVNCQMCPVSRDDILQPRAQLMTPEVAGAVASRLRHEFDVEFVAWGNWGEPLVHPEIVRLIETFDRVGLSNQFLSSSLSAKFDVEALVRSPLRQLDISLSGMTAEVYNVGHVDGRFDLIEENMHAVADVLRRHPGAVDVDVRWHRYRYNEHQLEEAADWAASFGFGFKPYYAHIGGIDALHDLERGTLPPDKVNFLRENVFLEHVQLLMDEHVGETSCTMDKNLVIHSDGSLLHCCALMASHQSKVDFLTMPREALTGFKASNNPYCGECLAKGWAGFTCGSKDAEAVRAAEQRRQGVGA